MTAVQAVAWKEWREHGWKVLLAAIVLPVYYLDMLLMRGEWNLFGAVFFTSITAAFFASDSIAGERKQGTMDLLSALPIRKEAVVGVKALSGLALLGVTAAAVAGFLGMVYALRETAAMARIRDFYGIGVRDSGILISRMAGLGLLAVLVYAASFVTSLLTHRVAAGLGVGIVMGILASWRALEWVHVLGLDRWVIVFLLLAGIYALYRRFHAGPWHVPEWLPEGLMAKELSEIVPSLMLGIFGLVLVVFLAGPIAGAFAVACSSIWIGATRVARERERGSLDGIYALPMPHRQVLKEKYQAGAFAVLILCIVWCLVWMLTSPWEAIGYIVLATAGSMLLYGLAFFASCVSSNSARALTVVVAAGAGVYALFFAHPGLGILTLFASLQFMLLDPIWDIREIWWPKFGGMTRGLAPWRRLIIPAVCTLVLPTIPVWISWREFLASDTTILRPMLHLPQCVGMDVVCAREGILIKRKDGLIEVHEGEQPMRMVRYFKPAAGKSLAEFRDERESELSAIRGDVDGISIETVKWMKPARESHGGDSMNAASTTGAMTIVYAESKPVSNPIDPALAEGGKYVVPSRNIAASDAPQFQSELFEEEGLRKMGRGRYRDIQFSAEMRPTRAAGPMAPALVIGAWSWSDGRASGWNSLIPWDDNALAVMAWPGDIPYGMLKAYRAMAVDEDRAKVYLIGDAGLTVVDISSLAPEIRDEAID